MSVFYKANNTKQQLTDWKYKAIDNVWHHVKNVWYKTSDNKWYPVWKYAWSPSPWSTCTKTCGGGTQSRTVICTRNDGVSREDIFCSDISKPPLTQMCNTQACYIQLYTSVDDWGYITPSNQYGNVLGNTVTLNGCMTGSKDYTNQCLYNYPPTSNINGYFYYIIRVDNVGNKNNGNSGFFARSSQGYTFSHVATYQGSWAWYPNGFNQNKWIHHGPWWRSHSGVSIGLFRIIAF